MNREVSPRWVETVPDQLEPGVLYVSIQYATTTHLCPCGCDREVVAPLSANGWRLIYDGAVSLTPSIGNWSFPCRSHYWIRDDEIVWAPTWSDEEVARVRKRRRLARTSTAISGGGEAPTAQQSGRSRRGWLRRLLS